jgi:hypothetical protein
MTRAVRARPQFLRHRQAHARGDLLGAQKILVRRVFEALALERDNALVAGGVRSLVDGHGEMATAQQRARVGCSRCNGGRDAGGVETGAGTHFARRGVVDDQHTHRPVALGLEDEAALEFECRAEQHRKHDRLAQKLRHRRRITVARKNRVDRRTEAHDAPPQIERLDLEGQDRVIRGGRRRRACWNFDAGIGHDA